MKNFALLMGFYYEDKTIVSYDGPSNETEYETRYSFNLTKLYSECIESVISALSWCRIVANLRVFF